MSMEASGCDPTAVERVFATELTAEERAELGAVCMRHGITPDHPVLLAVAEQLIFRRRLDERLSRFEAIAQRVEAAADRVATYRERPPTRRYRWAWLTMLALVAIVGLGAWFLGGAVAAAHVRLASARISSAIATPAGAAAMRLLQANGDALPQQLGRCQRRCGWFAARSERNHDREKRQKRDPAAALSAGHHVGVRTVVYCLRLKPAESGRARRVRRSFHDSPLDHQADSGDGGSLPQTEAQTGHWRSW